MRRTNTTTSILVTTLHRTLRFPRQETQRVLERVIKGERDKSKGVGVVFVNDGRMRTLNRNFLAHDRTTDVLSFGYDGDADEIGEIVVNLDQARRQARTYHVGFRHEVARLLIHGMLHVFGYRDDRPERKERMRQKEDRYLRELYA